jgi:CDP-diacylglycerol pyrophosphatase
MLSGEPCRMSACRISRYLQAGPCAEVDFAAGYVILKDPDPFAPTHFLLIPKARITRIKDPVLLSPGDGLCVGCHCHLRLD